MSSETESLIGRVMAGRFRIVRDLGEGGMGTVHEAIDLSMDRPIALKLLRTALAADEHQLARFEREARAAAKLSHPNVIGVTELVRDPELGLGLVMELLAGESLASRLERGPLSEAEAVNVLMQALDGLASAHAAGMVHRDLKPSNVFLVPLASGMLVKLLDFGIVKLAEEGAVPKLTRKGTLIGTPTYMSPEQVACDPVDARSDVYSMGACLYEALVAQAPYEEPHALALIAAVGAGPPPDLHTLDPNLSHDLVHIVRVAMSRDANGRYQSALAMREALRGAAIGQRAKEPATVARKVPPEARTETTIPGLSKPRLWWLAIPAALALIVGLTFAWASTRPAEVAAPIAAPTIAAPTTAPTSAPPRASAPPHVDPLPPQTAPAPLPVGLEPPPPLPVVTPSRPRTRPAPHAQPSHELHEPHEAPTPAPSGPQHTGRVGEDVIDPFAH